MKNQMIFVVTGVAVVALAAAAWLLSPVLQSPARIVAARADKGSERARRILDKYNAEMGTISAMTQRSGMVDDLSSERIRKLVEDDSRTVEGILGDEARRLTEMFKPSRSRVGDLDQRFADLDPGAEPAPRDSVRFGKNVEAMSRSLAQGVKDRDAQLRDNEVLLAEAAAAVADSISYSKGAATGADNLHANRLQGVTFFHQGRSAQRRASLLRQEASSVLHKLTATVQRIAALRPVLGLVERSGIQSAIQRRRAAIAEMETQLGAMKDRASVLATTIDGLRKEIADQLAVAEEARTQMEALAAQGLRYEDADALEQFRDKLNGYAATYRSAVRTAQSLQNGTLSGARLEDGGDYLTGRFVRESPSVEIEYQRGLDEYERDLAATEARRKAKAELLAEATAALARLQGLEAEYQARVTGAADEIESLTKLAQELFEGHARALEETTAAENEALRTMRQAAGAFKAAERIGRERSTDIPTLSPQAQELSPYRLIQDDRWLPAQAQCQAADAQVWAALVLYDRYDHLKRAVATFDNAAEHTTLSGYDRSALQQAIADARQDGEDLLEKAINALERADRDIKHWAVAASVAGANYALALFDNPALVDVAVANYQAVVEDRENNPYVRPFLMRLEQLRNR